MTKPILVILSLTLTAYWGMWNGAFIFDDEHHIKALEGAAMSDQIDVAKARAVPMVAFWTLSQITDQPWVHHLFSLAIHMANACLLFLLVFMLMRKTRWVAQAEFSALAVACLWAILPINTEAVSYITQARYEGLCMFFALLTAVCVVSERPWALPIAAVAVVLGLFTKQWFVVVPLIVLLMDRHFNYSDLRWRYGFHSLICGMALIRALMFSRHLFAAKDDAGWGIGMNGLSLIDYWIAQGVVIPGYIWSAATGQGLAIDHGVTFYDWNIGAFITLCVAMLLSVAIYWRWPRAAFPVITFWLLISIVSLFPIVDARADHRMYAPSAAIVALLVLAGTAFVRRVAFYDRVPVGLGLAGVPIILLSVVCAGQSSLYQRPDNLWAQAVVHNPQNWKAWQQLGVAMRRNSDHEAALACFWRSLHLKPGNEHAQTGISLSLLALGKKQQAEQWLKKAVRYKYTPASEI